MAENLETSLKRGQNRNFGLDVARALAISFVLVSHFSQALKPLGFWGVELFFGLSGFLIGNILWRNFSIGDTWNHLSILNFWSRRWWRTLPNYYLFLVITIIFQYCINNVIPSLSDIYISLWFGQYIVNPPVTFYGVSWSLCIEEWFYLLFPISLLILNRLFVKPQLTFIAVITLFVLASITIRTLIFLEYYSYSFPIREITFCRLDAIVFGVAIAFLSAILKITYAIRFKAFFAGIICLIATVIMQYYFKMDFEQSMPMQILGIITPLGFALTLPMVSVINYPKSKFSFINVCVKKISLWSYSIYLSHIPILFSIYALMGHIRSNNIINLLSKVLALVLTIVISGLLYNYFELPMTKRRPKELIMKKCKLQGMA